MKKLMAVTALGMILAGCTSVQVYKDYGYLNDPQEKMTDQSRTPYYIDYTVGDKRVTGEGSSRCWFWFFSIDDGFSMDGPGFTFDPAMSAAKNSATFKAVESAKCDALMGCIYQYTKTSKWLGIFKETRCEVKGFPANVKSINLIEDRPVVINKDQQIVRIKPWETLGTPCHKPVAKPATPALPASPLSLLSL